MNQLLSWIDPTRGRAYAHDAITHRFGADCGDSVDCRAAALTGLNGISSNRC
jgi:hypothetical protein